MNFLRICGSVDITSMDIWWDIHIFKTYEALIHSFNFIFCVLPLLIRVHNESGGNRYCSSGICPFCGVIVFLFSLGKQQKDHYTLEHPAWLQEQQKAQPLACIPGAPGIEHTLFNMAGPNSYVQVYLKNCHIDLSFLALMKTTPWTGTGSSDKHENSLNSPNIKWISTYWI